MKVGVVDTVAVDLSDIEIGLHFFDMLGCDAVCAAPDFVGLLGMRVFKGVPEFTAD